MKKHKAYKSHVNTMIALLIGIILSCSTMPASANGDAPERASHPAAVNRPDLDGSNAGLDPGASARKRSDLARVIQELDWLIDEVRRIEARSVQSGILFSFPQLAIDLGRVRGGIADHLAGRVRQPNDIVPIRGRYTRTGSHEDRAAR